MSKEDRPNPQPDPEATMLVLNPGGRRPGVSAAAVPAPPAQAESAIPVGAVLPGSGVNPLVRAANPLLDLVVPLRHTVQPPELGALRERLALAIRNFENEARESGVPVESVAAARYALCTLLDEAISGTAWGSGVWGSRSLLVAFHNEASGGEKFFLVLQRLGEDPARHLDLLELMYLCLALGLEGRFRLAEQGQAQLAALRERLLQLIRQHRGPVETDLSPHWRGQEVRTPSPLRRTPVWVLAATGCVLLVVAQLVASHFLNRASDPVFAGLSELRQEGGPARMAAPPANLPSSTAGFLAPEVAQGLVTVAATPGRTTITIRGEGMFRAGSAEVNPELDGLLGKIGEAISTLPGKVIVIGHTDNTRPALSARYPSNYELSKARAHSVVEALVRRAGPASRYSEEARGDTEPLVPNDSPGARARNRRVDVVVLAPPTAS